EQLARIELVPRVDAGLLHLLRHLLDQLERARVRLTRRAVGEDRDGHAPRALARDAPVGAVFDHAGDALLAPRRLPTDARYRGERARAQPGLLHADEPLRRRAEHDRRLVAPAVRI